ncbi:MAG TPA: ABC transporter permease subunit [Casimicrobiaceae bacterium]|nr:ABC transporter permease subunit [Casimicrobiaceae bacterium]
MSARWRGSRNALLLVAALLAIWQALYWWVGDSALASPLATLRYTARMVSSGDFGAHAYDTMRAFVIAFAFSVAIGLAAGFWLGFQRIAGDTLEPMLVAVYAIPKLTLYPILLLAFGLGLSAKVAFGVVHGVIPIILFTLAAVRNTKPILIKTGRVLKLEPGEMVRWILFPAAVPEIFTGLRVGFSLTLIGTLLAEMFASQRGLGYLLMTGIGLHNVEQVLSVTLLIVVFAAAVSVLLLQIDHRLHHGISRGS